jgi:hypothetical protein
MNKTKTPKRQTLIKPSVANAPPVRQNVLFHVCEQRSVVRVICVDVTVPQGNPFFFEILDGDSVKEVAEHMPHLLRPSISGHRLQGNSFDVAEDMPFAVHDEALRKGGAQTEGDGLVPVNNEDNFQHSKRLLVGGMG